MAQSIHCFQEFGWLKLWALELQEVNFLHHSLQSFHGEHPNPIDLMALLSTCPAGEYPEQNSSTQNHIFFNLGRLMKA